MITKEQIENIISEKLEQDNVFVVDLLVTTSNKIALEIDSNTGVNISYCVEISRLIEGSFDREVEDFELEVSSSSLSQPFKVLPQYFKNIGNEVKVTVREGKPLTGVLKSVSEQGIVIEVTKKVKLEGKKRKEIVVEECNLLFDSILKTEVVIKFK